VTIPPVLTSPRDDAVQLYRAFKGTNPFSCFVQIFVFEYFRNIADLPALSFFVFLALCFSGFSCFSIDKNIKAKDKKKKKREREREGEIWWWKNPKRIWFLFFLSKM